MNEDLVIKSLFDGKSEEVVLLKDIVIKAGTVFSRAPSKTVRYGDGHYEAIYAVGNSKNTCGTISYFIDDSVDKDESGLLNEYFGKYSEDES